ncbi:MAG TPA: laccase domain-containing protein [Verrucomicrobiae bacterium]|nr:laccase domain-containing protein [Verrucomicrobiae bacterium]
MIAEHQPTIFPNEVIAKVSSRANGRMPTLNVPSDPNEDLAKNRQRFLELVGISPEHTTQIIVTFDSDHYRRYRTADASEKGHGIHKTHGQPSDALAVTEPNHALLLPLADCVGAILYDPKQQVLMVSHLGRHSTEERGAKANITFLKEHHGCNPKDVLVWLSPAVGSETYPLHAFHGRSLQEVNKEQFLEAGILPENIEVAEVDTALHEGYYSHSQYLQQQEAKRGRFVIVAMMREQGEPA